MAVPMPSGGRPCPSGEDAAPLGKTLPLWGRPSNSLSELVLPLHLSDGSRQPFPGSRLLFPGSRLLSHSSLPLSHSSLPLPHSSRPLPHGSRNVPVTLGIRLPGLPGRGKGAPVAGDAPFHGLYRDGCYCPGSPK
jgi:hypothetical protein